MRLRTLRSQEAVRLTLLVGYCERRVNGFPGSAMALHVPKAPGFAQMLKEGAKVSDAARGSGAGAGRLASRLRSEGKKVPEGEVPRGGVGDAAICVLQRPWVRVPWGQTGAAWRRRMSPAPGSGTRRARAGLSESPAETTPRLRTWVLPPSVRGRVGNAALRPPIFSDGGGGRKVAPFSWDPQAT